MSDHRKQVNLFSLLMKHPFATGFIVLCAILPVLINSNYWLKLASEVFFYATLASAWNLIGGYGKQISWAHSTFFAAGAYSGVLLYVRLGVSPWIGIVIGCIVAVLLAILIGLPTFKLRGTYFAIATIGCCAIVERLLYYFSDLTGGSNGIVFPANKVYSMLTLNFNSELPFYYIALILMIGGVLISWGIQRSPLGFYLKAIREDEDAAESLGIYTYRVKLITLIISAVLTAIVGCLYVFRLRYVDPSAVASGDVAIRIAMTAIVGGIGTVWGPVMGAVLTVPLLQITSASLSNIGGGGLAWIIYGIIIILFVLFQPGGLIALLNLLLNKAKTLLHPAGKNGTPCKPAGESGMEEKSI